MKKLVKRDAVKVTSIIIIAVCVASAGRHMSDAIPNFD